MSRLWLFPILLLAGTTPALASDFSMMVPYLLGSVLIALIIVLPPVVMDTRSIRPGAQWIIRLCSAVATFMVYWTGLDGDRSDAGLYLFWALGVLGIWAAAFVMARLAHNNDSMGPPSS